MVSPPADFESAASAIPPPGRRRVSTPFLARALRRVKVSGAPAASVAAKSWLSGVQIGGVVFSVDGYARITTEVCRNGPGPVRPLRQPRRSDHRAPVLGQAGNPGQGQHLHPL